MDEAEQRPTGEGRDARGRFVKGAPAGPGRPARVTEREFIVRFRELVTPERFDAIGLRLLAEASRGNIAALRLVLAYLFGRPTASAPSLSQLAVEEEAGIDPLGLDIRARREEADD